MPIEKSEFGRVPAEGAAGVVPLLLYVPNGGRESILELLKTVQAHYFIGWEINNSELATHMIVRIHCPDRHQSALCYWYTGQLWAVLIQSHVDEYQNAVKALHEKGKGMGI